MRAVIKPWIWPLGVLIAAVWFPCFLQAATLRLNVLNAATSKPIAGAEVHFKIDGVQRDFSTDAHGSIDLPPATQGPLKLWYTRKGLHPCEWPGNHLPLDLICCCRNLNRLADVFWIMQRSPSQM